MAADPKRTVFAQRAMGLADVFAVTFGAKPVGTTVKYRAELATPDGPSTGGGKQALQAIKLIPIEQGTTLVVGHANQVERTAELRTYDVLARMQVQRFKGAGELLLDRAAYDDFLKRLMAFFAGQGMHLIEAELAPDRLAEGQPLAQPVPWNLIVGLGVGLFVLLGLIAWLRH